jgi:dolichol-phosphate mannosyltransferase
MRGLTPAVIDGFAHARGEVVACIDGDRQHDPGILPRMLKEVEAGADLVIASRHVEGGGVRDWHWSRRVISWSAARLARLCLGTGLCDPMSGYFMLRHDDFLRVRDRLQGDGFKVLLEIVARLRPQRVREVGYVFRPRTAGKSKLGPTVMASYLSQLWRLSPLGQMVSLRFLQFLAVGALGVVVNLTTLAVLVWISGARDWRGSTLATLIATVHNFVWNNRWTFRDRMRKGWAVLGGYAAYLLVSLAGLGITTVGYVSIILGSQFLAIGLATCCNYTLSLLLIWRKAKPATVHYRQVLISTVRNEPEIVGPAAAAEKTS